MQFDGAACPLHGQRHRRISGLLSKPFTDHLAQVCTLDEQHLLSESTIALAASEQFGDGILALSGMGCTIFAHKGREITALGGCGAVVYDNGSGYHVGHEALKATTHAYILSQVFTIV